LHALLVAAIFIPYMTLMAGLGYYIWRTGQPRGRDHDSSDEEGELASAVLPIAA
jgi:hypothetical protein